ncbi:MAG TPA: hypothetical protein ENN38_04800 [Actinobacteria bacterium]|nr:hypothetical protein [Actinomycetota bacterium]
MDKRAIEANIKLDSDRSFTVEMAPKEDGTWQMFLKNDLSGKTTELPLCKNHQEAIGGFGETMAKMSMQAVWGHADTWAITVDFCSGEKLVYGQAEEDQFINDEEIKKIRESMSGDGIKDAVDNAIEATKYFIAELSSGRISC